MEARELVYVLGARRGLLVLRGGGAADCALCCHRGQRGDGAWHERGGDGEHVAEEADQALMERMLGLYPDQRTGQDLVAVQRPMLSAQALARAAALASRLGELLGHGRAAGRR